MGNLEALQGVQQAYDRLTEAGLTTGTGDDRGLNNDALAMLGDLLTVAVFQTGAGQAPAEQVASATFRAALGALGDLYAYLADAPADPTITLKLLTDAVRTARAT